MSVGVLISFDGTDSSGKETQAKKLVERLRVTGQRVHTFATPDYNTASGQELKARLQNKIGNWQTTPWQKKMKFFATNRAEHRDEVQAALQRGEIVIYDRYVASSLAFIAVEAGEEGTISRDEAYRAVAKAEYKENRMPRENLSLFLDVPVEIATRLLEKRKEVSSDDDEYTDHVEIQYKLYQEYKHLCQSDPERFKRIVCTQGEQLLDEKTISDLVWHAVTPYLS